MRDEKRVGGKRVANGKRVTATIAALAVLAVAFLVLPGSEEAGSDGSRRLLPAQPKGSGSRPAFNGAQDALTRTLQMAEDTASFISTPPVAGVHQQQSLPTTSTTPVLSAQETSAPAAEWDAADAAAANPDDRHSNICASEFTRALVRLDIRGEVPPESIRPDPSAGGYLYDTDTLGDTNAPAAAPQSQESGSTAPALQRIRLRIEGAETVRIVDDGGALEIQAGLGVLREECLHKPFCP